MVVSWIWFFIGLFVGIIFGIMLVLIYALSQVLHVEEDWRMKHDDEYANAVEDRKKKKK